MNFSLAARSLGLAQSAVSRSIADLESKVGAELFQRSTRSVQLTPAGESFLEDARDLSDRLQAIGHKARRVASGERGHLRLGIDETASHGFCGALAKVFSARFPQSRLAFVACDSDAQRQALLAGDLDVGLMLGTFGGPGLNSRVAVSAPIVVILPAGSPTATRKTVGWVSLAAEPVVFGASTGWAAFRRVLDASAAAFGGIGPIRYEAPNMAMVLDLVRMGLGISFHAGPPLGYDTEGLVVRALDSDRQVAHTSVVWSRTERNKLVDPFVTMALQSAQAI